MIQKLKHTIAKPFCFWKLNWKISFELSVTRLRFEGSWYAVLAKYKIFLSMNHSSYMFLPFDSSNTFSTNTYNKGSIKKIATGRTFWPWLQKMLLLKFLCVFGCMSGQMLASCCGSKCILSFETWLKNLMRRAKEKIVWLVFRC